MNPVALKAYAKINLGLAVLGRRRDGYHELRTVYQSIALADHLKVSLAPGPRQVSLKTSGFDVPAEAQNLAVRAAEAMLEELNLRARVSIFLRKRIPPGSGLGGGSSDAATVLRAILRLSKRALRTERVLRIASTLGSDVPFFLFGGRALGLGRGEEVYPLPEEPRRCCILFFPGRGMDTAEAYRRLRRERLTPLVASPTIDLFSSAVNEARWNRLGNDFESLVFQEFPELAQAKQALRQAGAEIASLSGSGSALFGLFREYSTARRAAEQLRSAGRRVLLTRTISRREFQAQFSSPGSRASAEP